MLRGLVLAALLIDVGLLVARVLTYPSTLGVPGIGRTIALLGLSFIAAASFAVASSFANRSARLRGQAVIIGAVGGAILIAHMALENFGTRVGEDWRLTLVVMLTTFTLWFSSGWRTGQTSTFMAGVAAGCWTALVSVLLAITCGFVGMYFDVPSSAYVATWPEYIQSGASDPFAFAIANTLDAAMSHIAAALILGSILGGTGWWVASLRKGFSRLQ